jgi:hypothetical protein
MAEVRDRTEWWSFHCAACGEHTCVGKPEALTLEEFGVMALNLYGDPPVCTTCQHEQARSVA